jgi:hypothetical protein
MSRLKDVFIKHGMCTIEGFSDQSIFGIDEGNIMNICNNNLKSSFPYEAYGNGHPSVDVMEFAKDAEQSLKETGIKKITGLYKIYMDDGDKLVIEGGKLEFY